MNPRMIFKKYHQTQFSNKYMTIKKQLVMVVMAMTILVLSSGCENITKNPLKSEDISAVMPGSKTVEEITMNYDMGEITDDPHKIAVIGAYIAKDGVEDKGYIYKVEGTGYKPGLTVLVGIDNSDRVAGVKVIEHSETPGLGALVTEDSFISQFKDKEIATEFVDTKGDPGGEHEIQVISGATISSWGMIALVNKATDFHRKEVLGIKEEKKKPTTTVPNSPSNPSIPSAPKPTEEGLSPTKVYNWIQARYEYYDNKYNNGQYSGDKYTSEVFSDAAVHFKTTIEKVRQAYDEFRY